MFGVACDEEARGSGDVVGSEGWETGFGAYGGVGLVVDRRNSTGRCKIFGWLICSDRVVSKSSRRQMIRKLEANGCGEVRDELDQTIRHVLRRVGVDHNDIGGHCYPVKECYLDSAEEKLEDPSSCFRSKYFDSSAYIQFNHIRFVRPKSPPSSNTPFCLMLAQGELTP